MNTYFVYALPFTWSINKRWFRFGLHGPRTTRFPTARWSTTPVTMVRSLGLKWIKGAGISAPPPGVYISLHPASREHVLISYKIHICRVFRGLPLYTDRYPVLALTSFRRSHTLIDYLGTSQLIGAKDQLPRRRTPRPLEHYIKWYRRKERRTIDRPA